SVSHLTPVSPCIGAGSVAFTNGVDIDGQPWQDPPCMGADQVTPGQATGALTMVIEPEATHVAAGFGLGFVADNQGPITASVWNFGDGTIVTNRAYVRHAWSAPGIYTVTLTGYNDSHPEGVMVATQVDVVEQPVFYVNGSNAAPAAPFSSWETAATNIQDAVDAASVCGSLVLVTNGVYATGGRDMMGTGKSRVAIDKPLIVRSVNGPEATVIKGVRGGSFTRCVYMGANASLDGFTLKGGYAFANYYALPSSVDTFGGGALCADSAVLTNCVLTDNEAVYGGGTCGGILYNCSLLGSPGDGYYAPFTGNYADSGGGAYGAILRNCIIATNAAYFSGGGVYQCMLYNCTLTGNSVAGADHSTLYNCTLTGNSDGADDSTLYNCIVYFNSGRNYSGGTLNYCCTTPLPTNGVGNITSAPLFVNAANTNSLPDFRLRYGSPGIDTGTNLSPILTSDLDGNPRPLDGNGDGVAAFDMGAYEFNARSLIPSDWFTSHGLNAGDPQVVWANPDHDAFNTFQEWLAGTDPTNAASFFYIDDITKHSPAAVSFQSLTNRTYTLWSTPQLSPADWTPVSGAQAIPGDGGIMTLSDTNNAARQFYRVEVNLP
ncbi:MAG TPA: PKD domain-containing protein, partial [Verrucomicrobiae bacterium]|nr:PKD domain-containing protein [Verrucomicrobiae bacterium]